MNNQELMLWQFMWYIRSRDYDKAKQDGGDRKTNYMSSNDRTHASINHTVNSWL